MQKQWCRKFTLLSQKFHLIRDTERMDLKKSVSVLQDENRQNKRQGSIDKRRAGHIDKQGNA